MRNPFAKPWCIAIQGKWSGHPPRRLPFLRFRTQTQAETRAHALNALQKGEHTEYIVVPWGD